MKPDKNPDAILEERRALEDFLSKELGIPVKVIIPLSSAVILEGLANGNIDLAFIGSLDMLNAIGQESAQALLGVEFEGKTFYESYWVSLKDKPYQSISELKGKPVAFASRTSTSGYLIPHAALVKRDLLKKYQKPELFFGGGNVWYGTGYVSATERVLQGHAEAAAVSDYVINQGKYLTPEQKRRRGGRWLLRRFDRSFFKGQLCLLVGPSGSGKSSLLEAIAGVARIDEGALTFQDLPRPTSGWIDQHLSLAGELSALDNILMGSLYRRDWLQTLMGVKPNQQEKREINALLSTLCCEFSPETPLNLLSGG